MTTWLGNPEETKDAMELLMKKEFVLKVEDKFKEYLSYETKWTKALLGQPHLLVNLEKKFGKDFKYVWGAKTPGAPSFEIVCPINEDENISSEKQKLYCSGVGMLCYYKRSHGTI